MRPRAWLARWAGRPNTFALRGRAGGGAWQVERVRYFGQETEKQPVVATVVTTAPSLAGAGRRATPVSASNNNGRHRWSLAGAASGADGPAFESRLAH